MRFIWFFVITLNMIAGQCAQASTPDFNHAGVHYLRPPTIEQTDYEEGPLEQYTYQGETFSAPHLDQAQAYCAAQGAELISDEQMLALQAATPAESLPLQHNWPAGYAPYLTRTQEMHAGVLSNVVYFLDEKTGSLRRELQPSDQAQGYVSCLQLFDLMLEGQVPERLLFQQLGALHYTLRNSGQATIEGLQFEFVAAADLVITESHSTCNQPLAAGQQCSWQGQIQGNAVGIYDLHTQVDFTGASQPIEQNDTVTITSLDPPTTVKCPNAKPGSLFRVLNQVIPYRVMQDGTDAQAGVGNLALRDRLERGEEKWCTSQVTDMSLIFQNASDFNQPISDWDVSNVKTMYGMFYNAHHFNQYIGQWNVSAVVSMHEMFHSAERFNQPLAHWDVSHVSDMSEMFYNASAFNQPLESWRPIETLSMYHMFRDARQFNQPIGLWNVSHVTNMIEMFFNADHFNRDLTQWQVSQVTDYSRFNGGSSALPDAMCPHFTSGNCGD